METIQIDILNPKAINILRDLAAVDLIRINKSKINTELSKLLLKLRKNSEDAPSLADITIEVENVRRTRNV